MGTPSSPSNTHARSLPRLTSGGVLPLEQLVHTAAACCVALSTKPLYSIAHSPRGPRVTPGSCANTGLRGHRQSAYRPPGRVGEWVTQKRGTHTKHCWKVEIAATALGRRLRLELRRTAAAVLFCLFGGWLVAREGTGTQGLVVSGRQSEHSTTCRGCRCKKAATKRGPARPAMLRTHHTTSLRW
jgi:hypothetical protein